MSMALLIAAFVQGLAGSAHCAGMCGPFVHVLNSRDENRLGMNLLYNSGRSVSYMLIGMVFGMAGGMLNAHIVAEAAGWVGGFLILFFGVAYLMPGGESALWIFRAPQKMTGFLTRTLTKGAGKPSSAFLFGISSGLLPCGLLYPAYALSLTAGSSIGGGLVMLSFSLGTYPALLTLGGLSGWLWKKFNIGPGKLRLAQGIIMIGLGIFMLLFRIYNPHVHHHGH